MFKIINEIFFSVVKSEKNLCDKLLSSVGVYFYRTFKKIQSNIKITVLFGINRYYRKIKKTG